MELTEPPPNPPSFAAGLDGEPAPHHHVRHQKKELMSAEWTEKKRKEMLASFFKTAKNEFNRCLEFSMTCKKKAIRSHSIQNSRILDNLFVDGHEQGSSLLLAHALSR